MRKLTVLILSLLLTAFAASAQEKPVTLYLNNGNVVVGDVVDESATSLTLRKGNGEIQSFNKVEIRKVSDGFQPAPPKPWRGQYVDYTTKVTGFWCAVELGAGYNINLLSGVKSSVPVELTFTGGYRFSQFLQAGLGAGARYYFIGDDRTAVLGGKVIDGARMSFPLFVNARGLIIDGRSRSTLPFWSANVGYTIYDGFYFSPAVGLRFGSMERNHFILSLAYGLQCSHRLDANCILNSVSLKLGYQF